MGFVVLDTDAASQLQKERLPPDLIARHLTGNRIAKAFVTEGELEKWAKRRSWGPRRRYELHTWTQRLYVLPTTKESPAFGAALRPERSCAVGRGRSTTCGPQPVAWQPTSRCLH